MIPSLVHAVIEREPKGSPRRCFSELCLVLVLLVGALAAGSPASGQTPALDTPLRVLVVTGGHSHDASFYALFEGQPDLRVVVEPHPQAFSKNLIRDFDVIALYDMVQEEQVPEAQRAKLKAFAEAGKGLFLIHHALVSYQGWDWYWKQLAGGRYVLNDLPGIPRSDYEHDVRIRVQPQGTHPIVRGLGAFEVVDETYGKMQVLPEVHVLLAGEAPKFSGAVAWVSPYQQSRVVALQLGHDRQAHENAAFRQVFRRCLLWAGGRLQ